MFTSGKVGIFINFAKQINFDPRRMINNSVSPKLKGVLFDMDGVLFDSMPNHAAAWVKTASQYGIESTAEDFYAWEGATSSYTVNALFNRQFGRDADADTVREVYSVKTRFFEELPEPKPMEGAYDLLKKIKAQGLRPVIVTGSSQRTLINRIERTFPGIFNMDTLVTGDMVKQGKPFPEPYLQGLTKGGFSAREAIVVENAPLGVRSGRAAGLFNVAVNTGPLHESILMEAGANRYFRSMMELGEAWDSLRGELETSIL